MAMDVQFADPAIGRSSDVHTTQYNRFGYKARGVDGSEWVYVKGVASGALGKFVTFDEAFACTLLAANAVGPVGVLDATLDAATKYGWAQVYGVNTYASTDTVAADKAMFIDGTAGRVDDAVVTGDLVVGCASQTADTANVATVFLNYPFVTDVLG
jgi:hypothetical protein